MTNKIAVKMFNGRPVVNSFIDFSHTNETHNATETYETAEASDIAEASEAKETKKIIYPHIENETVNINCQHTNDTQRLYAKAGLIAGLITLIGVGISIKFYK